MTISIPARPTTYDGIEMRSRLEARVAAYLDRCGFQWEYEPRAYASRGGQYLPDFKIGSKAYLEVKGPRVEEDEAEALLRRMDIIRASHPDAGLAYCDAVMFRVGVFAINLFPGAGWRRAYMLRCPDHPDKYHLEMVFDNAMVPWCWECDPGRDVWLHVADCIDYMVGESDVA